MSAVHRFRVEMTCEGCSGAVERVLGRLRGAGVDSFNVNLAEQSVQVTGSLGAEELLQIIKKTGKATTYIGSE